MTDGFTVTDGSVEYKHSKPRAEYETVAPLVRLNFTIAEGSDPALVVHRVMLMAEREVESVLSGEHKGKLVEEIVPLTEQEKSRRGRPPKTVEPEMVGFSPTTEQDAEPEQNMLTLKGDIQPLAQKVSAHLAKVDGNINKLRAIIKECGGNSLLTIPESRWPEFIEKAKELLP